MGLLRWRCLSEGWGTAAMLSMSSSTKTQCSSLWKWFIKDDTDWGAGPEPQKQEGCMIFLFLPSETVICNVNQSSILPEIIYFRKFLTTATFFLWVSMDFRVSITAITKYSSPSMALVNKETWALFGVVLELIYLKHVLVPRQGKGVCQIHMQAGTAAVGSRNAHCLEYIQISELNRPHWTHI